MNLFFVEMLCNSLLVVTLHVYSLEHLIAIILGFLYGSVIQAIGTVDWYHSAQDQLKYPLRVVANPGNVVVVKWTPVGPNSNLFTDTSSQNC